MFSINLKPYEKYKDSGVEWLGQIPVDWEVLPTKRIFRLITDSAPQNNNMELLSVYTDIGVKPRRELEERGNKATTTDYYWVVKKGDIIVNKLLAWMGAVGISEYDGVTSPAYDVLRKIKNLNPYYYHFLFRNPFTHQELRKYSKGIMDVRLRLYFSEFGRIILPLPPLSIQNHIVEYLNHKNQQADIFIEKQTRLIELLKEQKKAIINQAVTKGLNPDAPMKDSGIEWLGEIPSHWEVMKLKYVCKIKYGNSLEGDQRKDGAVPVYGSNGVVGFHNKSITKRPCIIIGRKGSFGKINYSDVKCFPIDTTYYIDEIDSQLYCFKWLLLILSCSQLDQLSKDTGVPGLNREDAYQKKLPVPNREEQQQIVSYIESKTAKIDQAIEKSEKEITLVKEYLQSLIYHVVTGQVKIDQK
ncbi:MAG: restriction endonuclease subunit S [Desulfamplus sp.]|nr:restriction endonuclease subunit S [Desulfamplus sp.]